jgi:hypothetical protein
MIQQGPYKNCWTLKDTWRPSAGGEEGREGANPAQEDDGKLEPGDDEDMEGSDEEEEEDFEEVLE